jgi:prefoldin subunit 5
MKHFRFKILWSFAVFLLLTTGHSAFGADAGTVPELEKLSRTFKKSLDSLESRRVLLTAESEAVARQMDALRSRGSVSRGEHRRMERLLQESQTLTVRMDSIRAAVTEVRARYDAAVVRLLDAIGVEMNEVGRRADFAGTQEKQELLSRLRALLAKKSEWESSRPDPSAAPPRSEAVAVSPWNSGEEIRLKGDRLMDEAEALRAEIRAVEKRLRSLREEREVRKNVSELSRELALFDEREELVGRRMETAPEATNTGMETLNNDGKRYGTTGGDNAVPGRNETPSLPAGVDTDAPSVSRAASDLDGQISRLEKNRSRLSAAADSLEARASWFYKKAQGR